MTSAEAFENVKKKKKIKKYIVGWDPSETKDKITNIYGEIIYERSAEKQGGGGAWLIF